MSNPPNKRDSEHALTAPEKFSNVVLNVFVVKLLEFLNLVVQFNLQFGGSREVAAV